MLQEYKYKNLCLFQALKSNILKIPHHGSDSSSSKLFLSCVQPDVAVISVGKNNPFGHPAKEVIERIQDMGIEIYRTDVSGHIVITTNGKEYTIFTRVAQN